jgi:hypothetical protein
MNEDHSMNTKKRNKPWISSIVVLLIIFVSSMVSCKSPESPEEVIATIYVSNECGIAIDVYMDGAYQFSVEFLYYDSIQDLPAGTYEIVAKEKDTEEVLHTETIDIDASGDYWVNVLYDASIKIINEYGEALYIYTNGSLQGELGDGKSQVFTNVPFGEHALEASKASDNTFVASTTINVEEEKEYTWTIKTP